MDCPVCTTDHPTGRFTATYGPPGRQVTHSSRECGMAAANASVNAANINDPRIQGALRAVKRRFETNGLPEICPRCNSFCGDGSDCQRCGAWLGR